MCDNKSHYKSTFQAVSSCDYLSCVDYNFECTWFNFLLKKSVSKKNEKLQAIIIILLIHYIPGGNPH